MSDPDITEHRERLDRFHALSRDERRALALALLDRKDRGAEGGAALQAALPGAPPEMLRRAAYHAYVELPDAVIDLLGWLELAIRDGRYVSHTGVNFEVLYHLYNLNQIEAIAPWTPATMFDEILEVRNALRDGETDGALDTIEALVERLDGDVRPPDVEI